MTLAASGTSVSYIGNGNVNTFSFSYLVFLQTHLSVTVAAPSPSTTTYNLVLGTDYTVSGLSPSGIPAQAGSITLVNSGQAWLSTGQLATGYTITIDRVVPYAQTYSIRNQGDFYREFLEDALDYQEMQFQQQQTEITDLQDQITALQAQIAAILASITALQISVATLQSQVAALQSAVAALQVIVTSTGIFLIDTVNGNTYKLFMASGGLFQQQQ